MPNLEMMILTIEEQVEECLAILQGTGLYFVLTIEGIEGVSMFSNNTNDKLFTVSETT